MFKNTLLAFYAILFACPVSAQTIELPNQYLSHQYNPVLYNAIEISHQILEKESSTIKQDSWYYFNSSHPFYIYRIPNSALDSSGNIDISDTLNYYIARASNKLKENEIAFILINNGKYLLKKSIELKSNIVIKGSGINQTEFYCQVGENKPCFNLKPAEILPIAETPLIFSTPKGSEYLILDRNISNKILDFENRQLFAAIVKINDSGLITNNWAKGSIKEHFILNDPQLINNQYYNIKQNAFYKQDKDILFYNENLNIVSTALQYESGAQNTKILFYDEIKNAGLMCFSIKRLDTTASQTSNILLTNATFCLVKSIKSEQCNFAHITLNNSFMNLIKRNLILRANNYGNGGKGYGVVLQEGSSSNTISDNVLTQLRHSILLQSGANKNIILANYSSNPFWTDVRLPADAAGDLVLHGNYPFANLFEFNVAQQIVIDDSHGKNGPFNLFNRNWLQNYGIFYSASNGSDSQIFIGNEITNIAFLKGLYLLQDKGHYQYGNLVKNNLTPTNTSAQYKVSYAYHSSNIFESPFTLNIPFFYSLVNLSKPPFGNPFNNQKVSVSLSRGFDIPDCFDSFFDIYQFTNAAIYAQKSTFKIFPNPSHDGIFNLEKTGNLFVYDYLGKLVLKKNIAAENSSFNISISGIYFVKFETNEGMFFEKIIVQ